MIHVISVNSCLPTDIRNSIDLSGLSKGKMSDVISHRNGEAASVRVNRRLSSRSGCCLHSVTASLDKRETVSYFIIKHTLDSLINGVTEKNTSLRRRCSGTCFMTALTKPGCGPKAEAKETKANNMHLSI